jgi:hypothetical protein
MYLLERMLTVGCNVLRILRYGFISIVGFVMRHANAY